MPVPDLLRDDVVELLLIPPGLPPIKHLGESTSSSIPPALLNSCEAGGRTSADLSDLSRRCFWHSTKQTDSTINKQSLSPVPSTQPAFISSKRDYLLMSRRTNHLLLLPLPPTQPSSRRLSPLPRLREEAIRTHGDKKNEATYEHCDFSGVNATNLAQPCPARRSRCRRWERAAARRSAPDLDRPRRVVPAPPAAESANGRGVTSPHGRQQRRIETLARGRGGLRDGAARATTSGARAIRRPPKRPKEQ